MKKETYRINGEIRKPYCLCFKDVGLYFIPGEKYHCIHGFPVCHPDRWKELDPTRWEKDPAQDAQ